MNSKIDPIYIFVHIPKTAGTTLIKNITKNLKPGESLELNPETLGVSENINKAKIEAAVNKLAKKKGKNLNKIRFVYGHTVPYGIHKYFKRSPRYLTIVRNPAKRIASIYNYLAGQYKYGLDNKLKRRFKQVYFVNGKAKNFKGWYKRRFLVDDQDLALLNTFQTLVKLGYVRKASRTEKDFVKDLGKFYFVGITKNFNNDSLFLYDMLGIKKFFFSENISPKTVDLGKNPGLREQIEKDHPRSTKLFHAALKVNRKYLRRHSDYWKAVRRVRLKRLFLMPFTHVLYDPRSLAREIRRSLRRILPS